MPIPPLTNYVEMLAKNGKWHSNYSKFLLDSVRILAAPKTVRFVIAHQWSPIRPHP